jgi:branched-subunit amino acid ABC-type transport system permease component
MASGVGLTYRTTGTFSLALCGLATVATYVAFSLFVERGWAWQWAVVVAVFVVGPAMGLLLVLIARGLQDKSLIMRLGATVGILLATEGVLTLCYSRTKAVMRQCFWERRTFRSVGSGPAVQVVTVTPDSGMTAAPSHTTWASAGTGEVNLAAECVVIQ